MSEIVLALPVSVEQIAVVIKQMGKVDQQKILDLVPNLRKIAYETSSRTVRQAQANVSLLQRKVQDTLKKQPLSPDEPFVGELTIGKYHALSEEEKNKLWDEWADIDLMQLEEQEVKPNALSVG